LVLELDANPECLRARLQDLEQRFALDPAEPVPGRPQHVAAELDLDVVPACEPARDLRVGFGIGRREVPERRVGEHHAEPERIRGPVALEDHDLVLGRTALDEDAEIQPSRASADTGDLHRATLADPIAAQASSALAAAGWPGSAPASRSSAA